MLTTPISELATMNGSRPRSISRVTALAASFVCTVLSTRWPVTEARNAIWAVSRSRISPIMITSGSWRRIARSAFERLLGLLVDLHLVQARDLELDRVLDRGDVARHVANALERRVDERRLARARGAGHQHDALRAGEEPLELREVGLVHSEVAELHVRAARGHDAHHDLLAVRERERRAAQVDATAGDLGHESAVLRQTLLGDVEVREHLDPRHDRALRPLGQALFLAQETVHAQAHDELVALRLDVKVARAPLPRAGGSGEGPGGEGGRLPWSP